MEKTIALLRSHYYGNIILLTAIALLALFRLLPFFSTEHTIGVTIERYAIMITIIAIPVSLKYFAYRLKKMPPPLAPTIAIKKYKSASFLRLYVLSAVTLMHLLLFGISRNMNFFWFTTVMMIIFLFCRPSYAELENLTEDPAERRISEDGEEMPSGNSHTHPDINGDVQSEETGAAQQEEVKNIEFEEDKR